MKSYAQYAYTFSGTNRIYSRSIFWKMMGKLSGETVFESTLWISVPSRSRKCANLKLAVRVWIAYGYLFYYCFIESLLNPEDLRGNVVLCCFLDFVSMLQSMGWLPTTMTWYAFAKEFFRIKTNFVYKFCNFNTKPKHF